MQQQMLDFGARHFGAQHPMHLGGRQVRQIRALRSLTESQNNRCLSIVSMAGCVVWFRVISLNVVLLGHI